MPLIAIAGIGFGLFLLIGPLAYLGAREIAYRRLDREMSLAFKSNGRWITAHEFRETIDWSRHPWVKTRKQQLSYILYFLRTGEKNNWAVYRWIKNHGREVDMSHMCEYHLEETAAEYEWWCVAQGGPSSKGKKSGGKFRRLWGTLPQFA